MKSLGIRPAGSIGYFIDSDKGISPQLHMDWRKNVKRERFLIIPNGLVDL